MASLNCLTPILSRLAKRFVRPVPRYLRLSKRLTNYRLFVYVNLQLPLIHAIINEDWDEVARLWDDRRWMIE
jgi:hypothetical protein